MKRTNLSSLEGCISSDRAEYLKQKVESLTEEERRLLIFYLEKEFAPHPLEQDWDVDADAILTATSRSHGHVQRSVRGNLMKEVFERDVLPRAAKFGWDTLPLPQGDPTYDFLLSRAGRQIRVQLKLQRVERGEPKRYKPKLYSDPMFVVEAQRTRSGRRKGVLTRPYHFGDFDILAVCMQPVAKRWDEFRYTVAGWLIPRQAEADLIEIFQPVSFVPNQAWTDQLEVCLEWLLSGDQRKLL